MIPGKSIYLTLDKITSYQHPKKNSRSFTLTMESWVEWVDDEAKKGVDVFDRLETSIEIDIFEFLDWMGKEKLSELKTEAKNWVSKA